MITAKEALNTALSKYKTYSVKVVNDLITTEAQNGNFKLVKTGVLDDDAKDQLEEAGYFVFGNITDGVPLFSISWETENYCF